MLVFQVPSILNMQLSQHKWRKVYFEAEDLSEYPLDSFTCHKAEAVLRFFNHFLCKLQSNFHSKIHTTGTYPVASGRFER